MQREIASKVLALYIVLRAFRFITIGIKCHKPREIVKSIDVDHLDSWGLQNPKATVWELALFKKQITHSQMHSSDKQSPEVPQPPITDKLSFSLLGSLLTISGLPSPSADVMFLFFLIVSLSSIGDNRQNLMGYSEFTEFDGILMKIPSNTCFSSLGLF